jgi:hypothetical protein
LINTTMVKTRSTNPPNKSLQPNKRQDSKSTPTKNAWEKKNDNTSSLLQGIRKNMGSALEAAAAQPTPMETKKADTSMEIEETAPPESPKKQDYSSRSDPATISTPTTKNTQAKKPPPKLLPPPPPIDPKKLHAIPEDGTQSEADFNVFRLAW